MTDLAPGATLPLLAWTSPGFPVGAFTYSHGFETAFESGDLADAVALGAWLADLRVMGAMRNDAILAAVAWRAACSHDARTLADANDLAIALAPSRERQLEMVGQGNAFATAIRAAWPAASAYWPDDDLAYPVAFGAACATAAVPLQPSLEAFALAFVQNLVSAAIRLGTIGQTDGQRVIAGAVEPIRHLAEDACRLTLDDLGGCAQRCDIMALRHETLYSRLFRS